MLHPAEQDGKQQARGNGQQDVQQDLPGQAQAPDAQGIQPESVPVAPEGRQADSRCLYRQPVSEGQIDVDQQVNAQQGGCQDRDGGRFRLPVGIGLDFDPVQEDSHRRKDQDQGDQDPQGGLGGKVCFCHGIV